MSISTVWSLDVGKSSLKAVKIHREQSSLEILAVDKIDFEGGEAGIDSINQAKDALRTFAARNTIDCPVAVMHPSRSAFSRFIQLPPFDAKKLDEMIGFEAQQQIPFPIDEVIWDYHVADSGEEGGDTNVGIFAVRREDIADFMLDYEQFPLELISIGYIGLLNYVLFDLRPTKPVVVLDMGSDHTDLLIVDGKSFWFRSLPSAGKDFTQALQEKFKLDFPDAEALKTEGAKGENAAKIFQVVQPLIRDLVHEINRSIGFYKSQAGEVKFEDLFLFGNGSKLLGLKKSLEEQLKFRVHQAKGFHRLRVNRESNVALLQSQFPAFASCVGSGIQALDAGDCSVNLLPQEKQEELEFKKKQKTVLIAASALYLLIGWFYVSYKGKISSAEGALADTTVVKELDDTKKQVDRIVDDELPALHERGAELATALAIREVPVEAWVIAQRVFEQFDNGAVASDGVEVPENEVTAKSRERRVAQQQLNDTKWWFTGLEVRSVRVDPATRRLLTKETEGVPAYEVTLAGASTPSDEGMTEDGDQVRMRIQNKVLSVLQEFYSAEDYPSTDSITVETTPGQLRIFSSFEKRGGRTLRRVGETDAEQGQFFEFKLKWLQPIPPAPPVEENPED